MGATNITPAEVTTDKAPVYPAVLEELLPAAWHRADQDANNGIECDHGRLKGRLRPMRGLKEDRSARVIIAGHAFVQNVRRGHYEVAAGEPANRRLAVAFDELASAFDAAQMSRLQLAWAGVMQQRPPLSVGTMRCSSASSRRPARSASASVGTRPPDDTRFDSSNTADVRARR